MSYAVTGSNISSAWLAALCHLATEGGSIANLIVTVENPLAEDPLIRIALNKFIAERRSALTKSRPELVHTVANTLFPTALYREALGPGTARAHLFEMERVARPVSKRRNPRGTYFGRMVGWEPYKKPTATDLNQLEQVIDRLTKLRQRGVKTGNFFEVSIYQAGNDNSSMGFPCLSHISLSLVDSALHMTAMYRNHFFVRRAYGNYLGLGSLLSFICKESGWTMGELVCISTHADAEFSTLGRNRIENLIAESTRTMSVCS